MKSINMAHIIAINEAARKKGVTYGIFIATSSGNEINDVIDEYMRLHKRKKRKPMQIILVKNRADGMNLPMQHGKLADAGIHNATDGGSRPNILMAMEHILLDRPAGRGKNISATNRPLCTDYNVSSRVQDGHASMGALR